MSTRFVIVGGGFYGVCLALFFRSLSKDVVIVEREERLLSQASFVNQARVHTGFHYPRSFATAKRSLVLHQRFQQDFAPAIDRDFQMLYAVARDRSKVTAMRFQSMFEQLGAPIRAATQGQSELFSSERIEKVFQCDEAAFNATALRDLLQERLETAGIRVETATTATAIGRGAGGKPVVETVGGGAIPADFVFNATYARLNHLRREGSHDVLPIKNEVTELALVDPPAALAGLGVTVIDGPFFSIMPFPARDCYSLTHVRYTPHFAWHYGDGEIPGGATEVQPASHWLQMVRDATRFLPCMATTGWRGSLYVTKSVLERNEIDDGRPIFLRRDPAMPELFSVMGAKIDNIYDLFAMLPQLEPGFADAHTGWLFKGPGR